MLTQTQTKIMKLFVSKITKRFSLRGVSKELHMHQALVYRSSKELIDRKLIIKDDEKYILNKKVNHQELAYIEFLRSKDFLEKNVSVSLMLQDLIVVFPYGYFCIIVFGSSVISQTPRDLDILIIIEKEEDIQSAEKYIYNVIRNYTFKTHFEIVSFESVKEMLVKRDDTNLMTEVLNKHLILYGAELFYKLITKA